jgi:hypothetical protein
MPQPKSRQARGFRPATVSALAQRVAFMCSNPDCRRLTVKAATEGNGAVRAGQGAHIHSAGEGGPRFKPGMSDSECREFENGVWLCNVCAWIVDKDEVRYPPEILRKWKQEAESYVAEW